MMNPLKQNAKYPKILLVLAMLALPLSLQAVSGTGTSTATIVTPITIIPVIALAFKNFSANTGGTIDLSIKEYILQ